MLAESTELWSRAHLDSNHLLGSDLEHAAQPLSLICKTYIRLPVPKSLK